MRIAQLAPIYERVPPHAYGGTELIVHLLTEELVRRGHDVTLFATADSQTHGRLVSVTPNPYRYGATGALRHPEHVQLANAQACFRAARAGEFDVIHNHAGIEGMVLAETSSTPVLSTSHSPFEAVTFPIWAAYPWAHNEVSAASALMFPTRGRLPPILHGIDVDSFTFSERGEGYLLFLGRGSPTKGPDTALEVAHRTGRRLILAGKVDAADEEWWEEVVMPSIDGDRATFIGEADPVTKRKLLAGADALLFPITWDEPFGLVMVEALASGTPVVGFRRGSVPEVIQHGLTGFVVDDADGMVSAVGSLTEISRATCRQLAEERFRFGRMVDEYEAHYRLLVESGFRWEPDQGLALGGGGSAATLLGTGDVADR